MNIIQEIKKIKRNKNALVLAHFYQEKEIQDIADYVGDSYYLSKIAKESDNQLIVFCGVKFMAESAKILSPQKKVLIPDITASCLMADMVDVKGLLELKNNYDDVAIATYINSSMQVKAISDVIVTSANAENIISKLPQKNIIFSPDKNLGEYIAGKLPQKNIIIWQGFCPIHEKIKKDEIINFREKYTEGRVLAHLECNKEIRELANYIGSTSGMLNEAEKYSNTDLLIITEEGIFSEFNNLDKNNRFHKTNAPMICDDMKKISLEKLYDCLLNETDEINIEEEIRLKAFKSLNKMHELSN